MGVTSAVRRAGGYAAVGTLALAAPSLGAAAPVPFAAVALFAAFVVSDGPLFELFARPGDREDGRLNGLAGFALAATGLALLATLPRVAMPIGSFVAAVIVLAYGNLGAALASGRRDDEFARAGGFALVAFLAGTVGQAVSGWPSLGTEVAAAIPQYAFLAASGALVAALLRSVLYERDDPLVMLSVGLVIWFLSVLAVEVSPTGLVVALVLTALLGYLSYVLGTASVPGMLTGVLLSLLTIVLGGFGWFAVLIAFFGIGGLSTKFGYETKRRHGVAEDNDGARGTGNVLGNAAVALVAVVGFAASPWLPVGESAFTFAFAGSLAAAMSDTLSSEIGGLYDNPRLITTLRPVEPGTDGGVTWQGELAGLAGATLVAGIAFTLLPVGAFGAVLILLGGVVGMTADSLLGATVEGERIGNEAVNFVATLAGALSTSALALALL